ncbi:MAG TPA: outer membrane protein assembly factor BamC [Burkholderiales bacterium]|nr:outer membrane protein assembly factor BamC [Burkholderiales bacterium]
MKLKYALCAVAVLSGCSFGDLLPSNKIEYKSAGKAPSLEVPPDLTRPGRDDRYAIPDISPTGSATFSAYNADRSNRPRTANNDVLPYANKIRMQRAGGERWLVIDEPPEKVWTAVKEFWMENGFLLTVEMPDVGVMETDWAENRAKIVDDPIRRTLGKALDQLWSTGERDKYRTRLERAQDGRSTEVYISHRGMIEEFVPGNTERTVWQPRAPDPELEAEFLRRLMVRLGVEDSQARTLLTAAPAQSRSKLINIDGGSALSVDEPFDRAWRRVGLALDRVGFTVEDRDRSKGTYYVRYVDPRTDEKKSDGILSKLAFWRSDDKGINKAAQYRVQVREDKGVSQVSVLDKDGKPENSDSARKILSLLQEQLK